MLKNEYSEYNAMIMEDIAKAKVQYQEVIKKKFKDKEELKNELAEIDEIGDLLPGNHQQDLYCEFCERDELFTHGWRNLVKCIDDKEVFNDVVNRIDKIEDELNTLAGDVWYELVIQMAIHDGVKFEES